MATPDTNTSLLGKRKKKVPKCANPLFVKWLAEWRDEAQEKGWNSRFTYSKALASLKKYPLHFNTGKDCKILEFFGDKLCHMLDKKLQEHIEGFGDAELHDEDRNMLNPNKRARNCAGAGAGAGAVDETQTMDEELGVVKPVKKQCRNSREYIPAYRSAPYAILLTLYADYQSPNSRGFLTKKELSNDAQHLADKSLTAREPGSHYSGWSSMGSLVKKNYVFKEGNPAKYSITEIGMELARKILAADIPAGPVAGSSEASCSGFSSPDASPVIKVPSPVKPREGNYSFNKNITNRNDVISDRHQPTRPGLQFSYVDDSGKSVGSKDRAEVMINDEFGVGFLIKCKYADLLMCPKRYHLDTARCRDGLYVFVYLHNDDASEYSNASADEMTSTTRDMSSSNSVTTSQIVTSSKSMTKAGKNNMTSHPDINHRAKNSGKTKKIAPLDVILGTSPIKSISGYSTQSSPAKDSQDSIASAASSVAESAFTLYPGQFTVVLCVDNREHFGHSGSSKQNLLPDLNRNGVTLDVRNLAVGDFLWIAREKVAARDGQLSLPASRELVLDWIIERKRMDDLCGSIKDGRFKEQKFRMRNCGLRRPTYLIEAYGSAKHFGLPEDTLNQAIINSQIIDNFYVKHTRDQKETVAYLTLMTRQLERKFTDRTLISCCRADIEQYRTDLNQGDEPLSLLTFREFNKLNVKNQALTVRDMFAKQLMTISGMSHDKTVAIVKQYPTPRRLFQAYSRCTNDNDRQNLLSNIKFGQSNRNIGFALSKLVSLLYNNQHLL